jgi:hypothetical protein
MDDIFWQWALVAWSERPQSGERSAITLSSELLAG